MSYHGKCYCGAIEWEIVGKVDFTCNCHCTDCQATSGSAYGLTTFMIYDPNGVKFTKGQPKSIAGFSDRGKTTQRGFCGDCGSSLFNHVSAGEADDHWAIRMGSLIGPPPPIQKEIFMKSKPAWVPSIQMPENQYTAMPDDE